MIDLDDMTHEELAREAARQARVSGNDALADLATDLRGAVDDERDSVVIARQVVDRLSTGCRQNGG